jgi:hypothetical protein
MFSNTFNELFCQHSVPAADEELKAYSLSWRKPRLVVLEPHRELPKVPEPTEAQIEALYHLSQARDEGIDKGLVVAATGERVIIVMGAIYVIKSRVSGTLIQYNSCIA